MDETLLKPEIQRTLQALRANNMDAIYLSSAAEVVPTIKEMAKEGTVASNGGSVSLEQSGVMDLLRSGYFDYLDRTKVSGDALFALYRKVFDADWYFASANAITEKGEVYCTDANANRIAAITFGPRNVVLVVGVNKIVPDLHAAAERVRTIAGPKNAARLGLKTPCIATGKCENCSSPDRICCSTIILRRQRVPLKGRIKVLLVGEELGY